MKCVKCMNKLDTGLRFDNKVFCKKCGLAYRVSINTFVLVIGVMFTLIATYQTFKSNHNIGYYMLTSLFGMGTFISFKLSIITGKIIKK